MEEPGILESAVIRRIPPFDMYEWGFVHRYANGFTLTLFSEMPLPIGESRELLISIFLGVDSKTTVVGKCDPHEMSLTVKIRGKW